MDNKPRDVTNIEIEKSPAGEVLLKLTATSVWPGTHIEKTTCSRYVSNVNTLEEASQLIDKIIDWEHKTPGASWVKGSPQFLTAGDIEGMSGK